MLTSSHANTVACAIISQDLAKALALIYQPNNLIMTALAKEPESKEYSACTFMLNNVHITFRTAHTTPTKIGQFVTLWKRIGNGPIQPYDISDSVDFFVVSARNGNHFGQFVFPKQVLYEKDIVSNGGKGGKRAMRIYPPWDAPESKQASASQKWQLEYFLDLSHDKAPDHEHVKKFYRESSK